MKYAVDFIIEFIKGIILGVIFGCLLCLFIDFLLTFSDPTRSDGKLIEGAPNFEEWLTQQKI